MQSKKYQCPYCGTIVEERKELDDCCDEASAGGFGDIDYSEDDYLISKKDPDHQGASESGT